MRNKDITVYHPRYQSLRFEGDEGWFGGKSQTILYTTPHLHFKQIT